MKMMLLLLLLVPWLCSGPVQSSVIKRLMWYEPTPRTWMDARKFCKSEHSADLVTVVTLAEVNEMNLNTFYSWIGLRNINSQWYWDKGSGGTMQVQDWFQTPTGNKECGLAKCYTARPLDDDCENRHFFCCKYYTSYVFVLKTKSWEDAKQYCVNIDQEFFTNTVGDDLHWSSTPFYTPINFPIWIGQYQDGETLTWSDGDYRNWAPGPGPSICGFMWSQNKSTSVEKCSEALPSLCYVHNLLLVQELLTWEQARDHCRTVQHPARNYSSYHLLSVEQQDLWFTHSQARNATTTKVWLGLRFLGDSWFWSDRTVLSLPSLPSCPGPTLHCGALVVNRTLQGSDPTIEPSDCSQRLNVLCYGL